MKECAVVVAGLIRQTVRHLLSGAAAGETAIIQPVTAGGETRHAGSSLMVA